MSLFVCLSFRLSDNRSPWLMHRSSSNLVERCSVLAFRSSKKFNMIAYMIKTKRAKISNTRILSNGSNLCSILLLRKVNVLLFKLYGRAAIKLIRPAVCFRASQVFLKVQAYSLSKMLGTGFLACFKKNRNCFFNKKKKKPNIPMFYHK